jgi:Cu(I)/Ag(I) efflux system protein CusF
MKYVSKLILVMSVAVSAVGFANNAAAQMSSMAPMTPASVAPGYMSEGEVKNVDKDAGKLTIKHGELKNLGMPGMTMVFRVKDPAMLGQVKVGDKIHFVADKVGGTLTVTSLEVAK